MITQYFLRRKYPSTADFRSDETQDLVATLVGESTYYETCRGELLDICTIGSRLLSLGDAPVVDYLFLLTASLSSHHATPVLFL